MDNLHKIQNKVDEDFDFTVIKGNTLYLRDNQTTVITVTQLDNCLLVVNCALMYSAQFNNYADVTSYLQLGVYIEDNC